jgi:hypothetical protein
VGNIDSADFADTSGVARKALACTDSAYERFTITRCTTLVTTAETLKVTYIKANTGRIIVLDTLEFRKVILADTSFIGNVSASDSVIAGKALSAPVLTSPTGACTTGVKLSSGVQWSEITFYGTVINFIGGAGSGAATNSAPTDTGAYYTLSTSGKDTIYMRTFNQIPAKQYGAWCTVDTVMQRVSFTNATDSIKTYTGRADSGAAVTWTDSTAWITGAIGNVTTKINSTPIVFVSNRMWFFRSIIKTTAVAADVKVWYDRIVYRYR